MTRTEAREQAFILIFQNSFKNEELSELLETERENGGYTENEYCEELLAKVFANKEEIISAVGKYAKGWKTERISKVALSALKLAICEMKYFENIPVAVSINEAVELVKKYATKEDASFVNGILGSVSREKE